MRLLLDTNIYVYMVSDRNSLTGDVCAYIEDPENLKYLSIISLQDQDHKDPFDHIIIAQAISHKMTLISSDTKFPFYRKQGLRLIENL